VLHIIPVLNPDALGKPTAHFQPFAEPIKRFLNRHTTGIRE